MYLTKFLISLHLDVYLHRRFVLAAMAFLAVTISFMTRTVLSFAIIEMVVEDKQQKHGYCHTNTSRSVQRVVLVEKIYNYIYFSFENH